MIVQKRLHITPGRQYRLLLRWDGDHTDAVEVIVSSTQDGDGDLQVTTIRSDGTPVATELFAIKQFKNGKPRSR